MNSPFKYAKQFPFSKETWYYAAVLTLPAKKLFNNKEYQNMDQKEQMFLLNSIVEKLSFKDCIKYKSFEYHPNRNKSKPCLHMNLMIEDNLLPSVWRQDLHIDYLFINELEKITKSNMIKKICYCGYILTEIDVYNWVNYMFKDYDDHFEQLNDYKESLIEWAHEENYNERHKPLFNDLDYK